MQEEIKNEILMAIGNVAQKVEDVTEASKEIKEQVSQEMQELKGSIQSLEKNVQALEERIQTAEKEIKELKEETRNISRSIAMIEYEYGDKLKTLFDAFTVHEEKIEQQDQKSNYFFYKMDQYNDEIYLLKTKVQGS